MTIGAANFASLRKLRVICGVNVINGKKPFTEGRTQPSSL